MKLTFGGDRQVREHLALAAKHAVAQAQIEDTLLKQDPSRDRLHPLPTFPEDFSPDRNVQMLEMNGQDHGGQVVSHLEAAMMDESAPRFLENPDEFLIGPRAKVAISSGGSYTPLYYKTAALDLFQPGNHALRRNLDIPEDLHQKVSPSTLRKAATNWMHLLGLTLHRPGEVPLQDRLPRHLQGAPLQVLNAVESHLGIRLMFPRFNGGAEPLANVLERLWSNPY